MNSLKPLDGSFCLIQELAWLSEEDIGAKIREAHGLGIELLIPMLAAEHGQTLAPSRVLPVARESRFNFRYQRTGQPVSIHPNKDVFAILFDECQRLGMTVFMPTGTLSPVMPGSEQMWPYPPTEWFTPQMQMLNARFIGELAARYGHYSSLAGWYVSDEMRWSIDEHVFLVEAVADACRQAIPSLPVLLTAPPIHDGPRNEALADPSQVARLAADIICAADAGHFGERTQPWGQETFAAIECTHRRTRDAVVSCGKRYWANVELFVADLSTGTPVRIPAPASRALRQLEVASPYVERVLSSQCFGLMEPAGSKVAIGAPGSVELYAAVASHNASRRANPDPPGPDRPNAGAGTQAAPICNGSGT